MFLGEIVFVAVCLSVCGLINVAADDTLALPLDNRQSLWVHCDLLDLLALRDLVSRETLPFCEPPLWSPTDVAALSVPSSQNLFREHTKCLCLTGILV